MEDKHPLVAWVCDLVDQWVTHRDQDYKPKWEEYYRLFRGIHKDSDKTRDSERSKLINPALQQQVEMAVAEQEEATFGRGQWFDLEDDILDQKPDDALMVRDFLTEDLELASVPQSVSDTYLLGAIYGTGISKIIVEEKRELIPVSQAVQAAIYQEPTERKRPIVKVVPVPPEEFAIDPIAKTPDDGLGCAHVFVSPKHSIVSKQRMGVYKKGDLGDFNNPIDYDAKGERNIDGPDQVKIIEYAGLVPKQLLNGTELGDKTKYDGEMVEALITIANDHHLLKAIENPYLMKDRPFIAYQHDTVPNRFWGRGVCEKSYHPQKAADAELRARIDGLALSVHPMMGVDATRLPRGMNLEVRPGRMVPTTGNPNEVLMPFNFGNINPYSFRNSADMERMVQAAGGQIDSATPTGINPRNNTASGMSMMMSGAIKRSKRVMQNIDRNYLTNLINKALWRYIQFYPKRYPVVDYKFIPKGTMGIMAREYEQSMLTNLLQTTPPGTPAYFMLLKMMVMNSSMENKGEALKIVDSELQMSQNPQPKPDPQMERVKVEMERLKMEMDSRQKKQMIEAEELLLKEREVEVKEFEAGIKAKENDIQSQRYQNQAEIDAFKAVNNG